MIRKNLSNERCMLTFNIKVPWFDVFILIVCEFITIEKFVKNTTVSCCWHSRHHQHLTKVLRWERKVSKVDPIYTQRYFAPSQDVIGGFFPKHHVFIFFTIAYHIINKWYCFMINIILSFKIIVTFHFYIQRKYCFTFQFFWKYVLLFSQF